MGSTGKKPTPDALLHSGEYEKVEELDHDEIADFVLECLKAQTPFNIAFKLSLVSVSAIAMAQIIIHWQGGETLLGLLLGLVITFTVGVIIHELIHLVAYFMLGARKLSIVPKWRQGAVVAAADHFVLARKGFYFLALSPFILLTAATGFALYYFYTVPLAYNAALSFLFFHTTACIGDFAMASYFYENRDKTLYTFDDMKNEKSYFFIPKQQA